MFGSEQLRRIGILKCLDGNLAQLDPLRAVLITVQGFKGGNGLLVLPCFIQGCGGGVFPILDGSLAGFDPCRAVPMPVQGLEGGDGFLILPGLIQGRGGVIFPVQDGGLAFLDLIGTVFVPSQRLKGHNGFFILSCVKESHGGIIGTVLDGSLAGFDLCRTVLVAVQGLEGRDADIVYQGTAYRAVRFSQYRPPITYMEFSKYSTGYQTYPLNESNSAFYQKNKVYWFAYEPLLWRIINPSTGLLIADRIVDAQPYQNVIYAADGNYYCDPSCTIGANDYAHSSVRTWLTGTFCQTAFSAQETACITPTTLQILPYQVVLYDPIEDQTAFLFSCNATDNMYFYQSSGVTAFWANSDRDPSFYAYIQGAQEHHDHPLLRGCQPTSDISHVCYVGQTQMNPSQFAGIRPGICIDLEQYALLQSTAPDEPDTATLDALMDDAVNVTRALYTDASLAALDAAFAAAALASNSGNQTQIDEAASALQIAINNLEYRSADETALQDALARAAEIDRSLYTDESLAALDDAVAAAPANANITQQAQVTAAAEAITAALNGLQYKAADETALQDALARAAEIDRSLYTDESLAALDDAVAAAPTNANITQQAQVTAAADAIATWS